MQLYCPYTNIKRQAYPPFYLTCSVADERVPAWQVGWLVW
jgi:protease II